MSNDILSQLHAEHVKQGHLAKGCPNFTDTCPFCETFVREQRPEMEERIKELIVEHVSYHYRHIPAIKRDALVDRLAQFVVRNMMTSTFYVEEKLCYSELLNHPIVRELLGTH
jgi:hypothetical protein